MKRFTRAIALLLAVIMTVSLCSCSGKDGNGIGEDECVLTAGGHEISYGLYRYFFLNYKSAYPEEKITESPDEMYAKLHEESLGALRGMYAVIALCSEYGIGINDEDVQQKVETTKKSIMEQYITSDDKTGERGFAEELEANFMTETVFETVFGLEYCAEKLLLKLTEEGGELYVDDKEFRTVLDEEFIRVKQVYINIDETDRTYEESRKLAEEVRGKAADGADFRELVAQYSNDYQMTEDGYYMPRGYMTEKFETVAFSLEEDEVSEVLELSDGFHIIKRFAMDDEYVEKNFQMLKERYYECLLQLRTDAKEATVSISETELYKQIDHAKIALS